MKIKTIKVSENLYNGVYGEGSIFESSVNITMSQELFGKNIEKLTNDSILSANFRRSFMDNNLSLVTIELPATTIDNIDRIIKIINEVARPEYRIIKEQAFNLETYLQKITIVINGTDEYEIDVESELAKELISLTKLDELISKTNREIITSINI